MDDLIKPLIEKLGPTYSTALGAVVLAGLIIPQLLRVRDAWREARTDKRAHAADRERLELTKLWLEVEAFRKQHDLTPPFPIPPPTMLAPISPAEANSGSIFGKVSSTSPKSDDRSGLWRWLAGLEQMHRMWSTAVLFLLGILALPSAFFGLAVMVMMWLDLTRSRIMSDVAGALFVTAFELGILLFIRALHRQYTLITLARHRAESKGREA